MKYIFSAAFVLASLAIIPASFAQDSSTQSSEQGPERSERSERPERGERGARNRGSMGGPSAEAITACEGLTENAVCTFTAVQAEVTGTCQVRREDALVCRPDGPPASRGENGERGDRPDREGPPSRRNDMSVQD